MTELIIRGGRVLDPAQQLDRICDLRLAGGVVAELGDGLAGAEELDARGLLVVPGLIDLHAHLREPGAWSEETIATGSAAAVAGGFSTVLAMPNTDPPIDSAAAVSYVYLQAARADLANVFPAGCVTRGRSGRELAGMAEMDRAGAVAFSDDGDWIVSGRLMRRAFEYARGLGRPILCHCEESDLVAGGVANEGFQSVRLGLAGRPACAEEIAVYRDLRLAESVGARVHVCHLSTAGSVELVRAAKRRGLAVTAEVTPHHLTLTDAALEAYDPAFKMNPPLRTAADCQALIEGLADGTIDAVATDHAPHPPEGKELEFAAAPAGVVGLETALGVVLDRLVEPGLLGLAAAIGRLTAGPAAVLGLLPRGTLRAGAPADVTVIDPERRWRVEPRALRSAGKSTPFAGWELKGRAVATVVGGRIKYRI
jgi:dihydroorotase